MATPRIELTDGRRRQLLDIANSPASSTRLAMRARIVLALERLDSVKRVAAELGVSAPTVSLWRKRFAENGVDGLMHRHDATNADAELQRLLDAAERTVSKRGFCETRMSDIAAEAGVSASLITYYFESRAETLVRAMTHANERAAKRFEAQLARDGEAPHERLARLIERVVSDDESQQDEYLLELDLLAHARQHPEFVDIWTHHQGKWISGFAEIISEGVADGSFQDPGCPAEETAQQLLALIDGFGYQLAIGSTLVTRDSMGQALVQFVSDRLGVALSVDLPT